MRTRPEADTSEDRPRSARRSRLVGCVVLPLLACGACIGLPVALTDGIGPDIAFDSDAWRGAFWDGQGGFPVLQPDATRARMVNDLLANHLKPGMSRAEVEALKLGYSAEGGGPTDWVSFVDLFQAATPRQRLEAILRWGSPNPRLVTTYRNDVLVDVEAR